MKQNLVTCSCGLSVRTGQEEYFCPKCKKHIVFPKDQYSKSCAFDDVSGIRKPAILSVGDKK